MATALRHQAGKPPQRFEILAVHSDGTVDLGTESGVLVIGKCPLAKEPAPGVATLEAGSELPKDLLVKAPVTGLSDDRTKILENELTSAHAYINDLEKANKEGAAALKAKTVLAETLQSQLDEAVRRSGIPLDKETPKETPTEQPKDKQDSPPEDSKNDSPVTGMKAGKK